MPVPDDLIRWHVHPVPTPTVIGGEQHYKVESILDSRLKAGRLEFLVNWKAYGYEENSWMNGCDVSAPWLISQFYHNHPGAPCHISVIHFDSISVAMAQLSLLVAQLKQLSQLCGSGSQANLIFTAAEQLRVAQSGLAMQI